jgi:hypothetical protein
MIAILPTQPKQISKRAKAAPEVRSEKQHTERRFLRLAFRLTLPIALPFAPALRGCPASEQENSALSHFCYIEEAFPQRRLPGSPGLPFANVKAACSTRKGARSFHSTGEETKKTVLLDKLSVKQFSGSSALV